KAGSAVIFHLDVPIGISGQIDERLLLSSDSVDRTNTPTTRYWTLTRTLRMKETAMSRFTALWRASPRKVLLALGGLMLVAALAIGSGANFNSTSANPSNVFTAGTISHSNSKAGAAILTAANIVPGGSATGTVDIKNTGTASGTFTLAHTVALDTPASPGLSKKLTM